MTTYVVPDGMKRKPTAEEWEIFLENRIPELIRRAKAGNFDPNALIFTMQKVIEGEAIGALPAEPKPVILRCVSASAPVIIISATAGTKTIAPATDVFTWGIDPDFKNWGLDVPGLAKPETPVKVHEMTADGDFKTIYDSLGGDLDKLCLEQEQIIAFVHDHKKWLRTGGYATFFLFKVGEGKKKQFFVASVFLDAGERPYARVRRFSDASVWDGGGRHRIVVPQLTLAA